MEINMVIDRYKLARYNFFKWRCESSLIYKVTLAFSFACLTGLSAQFRFYLPGSPVPITGQTFAVLLAGILLGKWWGGISQGVYVGIGAIGVPWFAGFNGGIGYLFGPTGGYIIGFIFAAFFLGYFMDNYVRSRGFLVMLALMLFANFVLIFTPGLLQLYFFTGASLGIWELLMIGMIPFIAGDLVKVVTAAAITKGITPKRAYNGEVDAKI
jgi:biotin transport system substrate-specific component